MPPALNQFVSFELPFTRPAPRATAAPVHLHVFADTRYRLFVNDRFVAYGPARFVTGHPEFDTFTLDALLVPGLNRVRVEVNFYGASSFQTMPDGRPGFIAAGGTADGSVSFATPGAWRARLHRAWDADAPAFSFAQNPAEICDTRLLATELAAPAVLPLAPLPPDACPWPKPSARSAPQPDYAERRPKRILVTGPVDDSLRWGRQLRDPGLIPEQANAVHRHAGFASWIHSPRAQSVSIDCFWGELALNGAPLAITHTPRLGNHREARADLREGWNFLTGNLQLLVAHWSLLLGFPAASGVSLHARPDRACPEAFLVSPPLTHRVLLAAPGDPHTFAPPAEWVASTSDLQGVTPARLVAWDSPSPGAASHDLPWARLDEVSTHHARSAIWNFDYADEYYGQPTIEVDAPAGSVLDIAYDDWKRDDGCVNLYHSNPFTDAADRFILRGGRQRIEVLNPRGGIFLQLVLRVPAGTPPAALTVHDVAVRRRTTLTVCHGSFTCGDPVLDWAWRASVHTLMASTDEAYADCPWRERGSYIGDSLVNLHLHRLVSPDLSVARRTFANFGHAQLPDGQLACCAPSWLTRPHEDFTLIWVQAARDYWAATGDVAFAAQQWPVIRRIFDGPSWTSDADGLWDGTGHRLFIDWGVLASEREGAGNAVLNILRIAALRAAAELATVLGRHDEAASFRVDAADVNGALLARTWNETEGRFNASIGATTPAVHANILALLHGVGPAQRILTYLEPLLRTNFQRALKHGHFTGYAELYFFYHLLPALVAHDRVDLAEELVQTHYGFIRSLGYPTLPECFSRAHEGSGSCCHSWSGAPALYATQHVLGLRQARPGDPDHWVLDPADTGRDAAEGSVPHARGLIRARWQRAGGRIHAEVTLPQGVTLKAAAHVTLAPCPAAVPA